MVATAKLDHKVKGLLKGLRYISQIFENEKEQEMVIGHPTDVKHVAHIGWDGPVVNTPIWMNDFHSAPLSSTMGFNGRESVSPKSTSQEIPLGGIPPPSPARDETASTKQPRRSQRHASTEAARSESPARDSSSSRGTRHSRKNQTTGSAPGSESPARESSGSLRRGRRHHRTDNASGSGSAESSDLPSIPKQKKKERRSKGSTDGGSSRSSRRSKNPSFLEPGAEEAIARPVTVKEAA